ncbi:NAD(P)H-hydrate dehydratase [Azospirillum doebereinerae]|uniref:NAD(P)H-hydrate dehydratase n=1 Tax=Azospirillum doebereinerae TaxID=92933 RepID=UPI003850F5B5
MATSGSGDTLAGILVGLLARGATPLQAALWSVWLHGEAGNRLTRRHGPLGFLARELLAEIPAAMAELAG